jgi:Holliday junction resolvasome RuvABC DNA-binding subunit
MEGVQSDAVSALVNLGYTRSHAAKAVTKAARALGGAQDFEKVIKQALRALSEQAKG